ncbi:hypothetical protein AAG570_002130 [Ranatra chinensis]|uniref:Integrase catalytic domain-containing protein n=1 Tax=Ranatra chinensis TaxID=642074 RepID=A0ABD0YIY7_9HEMI
MATKFLFAKCLSRKTGEAVKEGILEFCGTVGIPKTLTTDPGTEFSNRLVRTVIDELDIQTHTTTPGHHQSHGAIERLHSTMPEHMRIWYTGKGIKGPEAVARTVLAYNESVHSATKKKPTELMRAWKRADNRVAIERESENIGNKGREEKIKLLEKLNEKSEFRKPRTIREGQEVFIKNLTRRKKGDTLYKGPYKVKELLARHRAILAKDSWPDNRAIIRHMGEIRTRVNKKKI